MSACTDDGAADYSLGCDLEANYALEALAAYERCLAVNKAHHESRPNCGRLLHLSGQWAKAERVCRDAERIDAALLFNLARLHECAGNQRDALRHLLAYRRLIGSSPESET
jgi:tetratricopeptide (TPR) repeat protein